MLVSAMRVISLLAIVGAVAGFPFSFPKPAFVTTKGQKFQLNGKDFYISGTNAYWWTFLSNLSDTSLAMDKAKAAGLNVVRVWGFNEKNATFDPNGLPKYSNDDSPYFQSWKNGKATINYGPNGLQHFDKVVALAERKGLKLTVALTNNWADYGGLDVYNVNLGSKYHDDFYTSAKVKAAFKNYVRVIVNRYAHSSAIFAWELGNEPRCGADNSRNLPRSPSGCNPAVLTSWVKELSAFIKSIDPLHLVTTGDEGFFNIPGNPDPFYAGNDGVDAEGFLKVKTIDFGTFHLYPDWWSQDPLTWSPQYVKDHGALQRKVGKPVVFEEYGWMTPETRLAYLNKVSNVTRVEAVGLWQRTSVAEKLAGDQYWQFGVDGLSFGDSTNDGFTIYLQNKTESIPLIYEHVKAVQALAHHK